MSYTYDLIYFGTTALADPDDLTAIVGSINSWADPNGPVDGDREYSWLRHQAVDGELRIRLAIRDLDDPGVVLDDFADFIDLELNGPFGLTLDVPPDGTTIAGIATD